MKLLKKIESSDYPVRDIPGGARRIRFAGGTGLLVNSIHGRIPLDVPGLTTEAGTCIFWMLPLETLSTCASHPNFELNLKFPGAYPLLSTASDKATLAESFFKLTWDSGWHPQMVFRMEKDLCHTPVDGRWSTAVATTNHLTLHQGIWHHVALVWNHVRSEYQIFLQGIPVARNNSFPDPSGTRPGPLAKIEQLYSGHPVIAFGSFEFYGDSMSAQQVQNSFMVHPFADPNEACRVRQVHYNAEPEPFTLDITRERGWQQALNLPLDRPEDMQQFHVQGNQNAASIYSGGLLVETPLIDQPMRYYPEDDVNQLYLWSRKRFEGDIYLRFRFQILQRGGLGLICVQSTGIQGEDFMEDHPLRTTGSMRMVHLEDVRNYHWEYYREMNDTRNDGASHALLKNPWLCPLAFSCQEGLLELNTWHTLEFYQNAPEITGAIDGKIVLAATDSPITNNGPLLQSGRIALRCMIRTKMIFRDLEVWTRPLFHQKDISCYTEGNHD
jgi:hypothetical protein